MKTPPLLPSQPILEIIDETGVGIDPKPLEAIALSICAEEMPEREVELSLLICDSVTMRKLNRCYRGKDKETDVLTFLSDPMPQKPDAEGLGILIGDIVVDINQADRQKGSHSLETELQLLFIHGLLHLLGHDHIKPQDKKTMEHKEEYYRQKLIGAC